SAGANLSSSALRRALYSASRPFLYISGSLQAVASYCQPSAPPTLHPTHLVLHSSRHLDAQHAKSVAILRIQRSLRLLWRHPARDSRCPLHPSMRERTRFLTLPCRVGYAIYCHAPIPACCPRLPRVRRTYLSLSARL